MDHSKLNRSLQIRGKAKLISLKSHPKEFMKRIKKLGILTALEKIVGERVQEWDIPKESKKQWVEKILNRFNLIRINPEEITFLYIHPTKGAEKDIWKKRIRSK